MHRAQGRLSSELEELWLATLSDAGISADQAVLVPYDGDTSPAGECGTYLPQGQEIDVEGLDQDEVDRLNSNEAGLVDAHRILIWTDRCLEALAGILRHEVEHARQFLAREETHNLHDLTRRVVSFSRQSGSLYQQIPTEADANAAAGVWVRARFGSDAIERLVNDRHPDSAVLRPTEGPSDPYGLPERMVQFLASIPDLCRDWARSSGRCDFHQYLDLEWSGAGKRWLHLAKQH